MYGGLDALDARRDDMGVGELVAIENEGSSSRINSF